MTSRRQVLKAFLLPAALTLGPVFAQAQTQQSPPLSSTEAQALKYTNNLHLGYMRSGSARVDGDTKIGMDKLAADIKIRTVIGIKGAAALSPEDDLSFFQFIYWPVTPNAQRLSDKARERVQEFLDGGGMILFDIRDADGAMRDPRALQRLVADLNIPPLVPMPKDHGASTAFYALSGLPGSSQHGAIWVDLPKPKGTEALTSTISGDRNWGDAWAGKTVLEGTRERELAIRAGINLVLLSYMGNASADPIHKQLEILKNK